MGVTIGPDASKADPADLAQHKHDVPTGRIGCGACGSKSAPAGRVNNKAEAITRRKEWLDLERLVAQHGGIAFDRLTLADDDESDDED